MVITFGIIFYTSFFSPQLLNGPIVRPNEFFPQLADKKFFKFQADRIAAGLTIFSCGLFKKVVPLLAMASIFGVTAKESP